MAFPRKSQIIIVQDDDFAYWNQTYPMKTKETLETMSCLQRFLLPSQMPEIIYTNNSNSFSKSVNIYKRIMAQAHLVVHTRTEWQKGPSAEWMEEQPWHWCNVDCQKHDGTMRWNSICTCATCTTVWPMTRQHSRSDMAGLGTDHHSPQNLVEYIPNIAKDRSRIHQFGQKR